MELKQRNNTIETMAAAEDVTTLVCDYEDHEQLQEEKAVCGDDVQGGDDVEVEEETGEEPAGEHDDQEEEEGKDKDGEMEDGEKKEGPKEEKQENMRISFKISPVQPENIFTPEFREKMKVTGSKGCVVYLQRKADGSTGEFSKVEMHFDNIERRDEVLDSYLSPLNKLCEERSLDRKVWCYPFRDFKEHKREIEEGLMLYAMNIPPEVTHSQFKAMIPEAEEIILPVDESGKTLGHVMITVPSLEVAGQIYQKKYRLNNTSLKFYRPATRRNYVKNLRIQKITTKLEDKKKAAAESLRAEKESAARMKAAAAEKERAASMKAAAPEKASPSGKGASGKKGGSGINLRSCELNPGQKGDSSKKGFPGAKAVRRAEWIAEHGGLGGGNLLPNRRNRDRRNYYDSRRDDDMGRMRNEMELQMMMMRKQLQQDMKTQLQEAMQAAKTGGDDQGFNSNKRKRNEESDSGKDFTSEQPSLLGSGPNMNQGRQWGDMPDNSGGGYNYSMNPYQGYGGNYY